jgi:hypothetical protein
MDRPDYTLLTSAISSIHADNLTDALDQIGRFLDECGILTLPDGSVYEGQLQHDDDGRPIVRTAECGHCGFRWNDALITSMTPTPSGRCPNEYGHEYDDEGEG